MRFVSLAAAERKANHTGAVASAEQKHSHFDDLLHDPKVRDTAARALDLIHFKYGESLLTAGQAERRRRNSWLRLQ